MDMNAKLCLAAVLALSGPASADSEFTGAVDSDWFNPLNWTDGIPVAADFDNAILNAGVSAFAGFAPGREISLDGLYIGRDVGNGLANALTSEVDLQISDFGRIYIGYSRFVGGNSVGRLNLSNASVRGTNLSMEVGVSSFDTIVGDPNFYGDGIVNVVNGDLEIRDLEVGFVFQDGGNVSGALTLTNGNLIATGGSGSLSVAGVVQGSPGSATGNVTITNGSIQNYRSIEIGGSGNAGFADGRLQLINSTVLLVDFGSLDIGSNGNTRGALDLDSSYVRAEVLDLESTGVLNMTVNGLTRASDSLVGTGTYSAMDIGFAGSLEGVINIDLGGLAFTTGATFDLITLDAGSDFSFSQFADIQILNLGSGMTASTEYVPGDALSGGIFRLTVVPAPGAIFLFSLAGITTVRRPL